MKVSSLVDVLCAAHWSWLVRPDPFERRGGIMLVAPGGHGKSTILGRFSELPKVLSLSDFTTRQAVALRSQLVEGRYRTLIIDEMEKLYQRHDATSANLEGTLQALIEQGFSDLPGEKPSADVMKAQCMVVTGMTEEFYVRQSKNWTDAFLRRWIICKYTLEKPEIFGNSIEIWQKATFNGASLFSLPMDDIPYSVTRTEQKAIHEWLTFSDRDDKTPQQLLHKILSVLRWKFKRVGGPDHSFEILEDFAKSMKKRGTILAL